MSVSRARRPTAAGLTTILVVIGAFLLPSPAEAVTTTVDCSAGKVVLKTTGKYDLVGACDTVVIKGLYITVSLTSARQVVVRNPGADITASDRIGSLRTTRAGGGAEVSAPRIRLVDAHGATLHLKAARVTTLRSTAPYARVTVGSARRAFIPGETSTLRFITLGHLTVGGTRNTVRVKKGSTHVRDYGYKNSVKVHHRLPA